MQNTCWHQQLLHDSHQKLELYQRNLEIRQVTLGVACWTWSWTSAHMFSSWATRDDRERLWLLWEEAGTRESSIPSAKCRARRVLLGNCQAGRWETPLPPGAFQQGTQGICWALGSSPLPRNFLGSPRAVLAAAAALKAVWSDRVHIFWHT